MNGQWFKGFALVGAVVVLAIFAGIRGDTRCFVFSVALWLAALSDAVWVGRRIARGEAIRPWTSFGFGGSPMVSDTGDPPVVSGRDGMI